MPLGMYQDSQNANRGQEGGHMQFKNITQISKAERLLTWTNVLSRMRNGDDLSFYTSGGIVSILYRRDSLFHTGEWEYRSHITSNIKEVLDFLEVMEYGPEIQDP